MQSDPALDFFGICFNETLGFFPSGSRRITHPSFAGYLGPYWRDPCQNSCILSNSLQSITIEPIFRCKTLFPW